MDAMCELETSTSVEATISAAYSAWTRKTTSLLEGTIAIGGEWLGERNDSKGSFGPRVDDKMVGRPWGND